MVNQTEEVFSKPKQVGIGSVSSARPRGAMGSIAPVDATNALDVLAEDTKNFNRVELNDNLKKDVESVLARDEELEISPDTPPVDVGIGGVRPKARPIVRPKARPKPKRFSPIDKVLELNYLLKGKSNPNSKTTRIISGLDQNDPVQQKTIKGFFDSAVGGESGYDPTTQAWCAAFVSHILEELGADPLKAKDRYKRLRADEFKRYGTEVKPESIKEGDIVVFDFDQDGKADHVTFYAGDRITSQGMGGYINVLGGNQSGQVSIRENHPLYTWDNVAAVRRITYNDIDFDFTKEMAERDPVFNEFMPDYAGSPQPSPATFNEGGPVMKEQMQMAFMNEGGIADDGLSTDPVSGNSIPPGSLAEEVRDDIPAQLSEGEYVVPADVVRFFGVKFFEDLRMDAKAGLASMEANGRIGGEPVPVGGPQANEAPVTEQEMASLRELAMEMNQGGIVPSMNPNTQQPPQALGNSTQAMNRGGTVLGFDGAGDVGTANQAAQASIPSGGGLGFSLFGSGSEMQNATGTGDTSQTTDEDPRNSFEEGQVVYLYKDNQTLSFYMMADYDDYQQKLSDGWATEQTLEDPEISPIVNNDNDGGGSTPVVPETTSSKDPKDMSTKELTDALNSMGTIARAGSVLATSMGLPVGAIVSAGLNNQYNNILAEAKNRGHKLPDGVDRKGSVFGGEGSIFENLYEIDEDGKIVQGTAGKGNFGDTWLGDLLGFDGSFGVQGPGFKESFDGARRYQGVGTEGATGTTTPTSTGTDGGQSGNPQGSGGEDDGPGFTPVATQEQISQAQEQATSSAVASGATQEEAEQAGAIAGGQMGGKGYVGGYGFKEGGLMVKGKKKKKKK